MSLRVIPKPKEFYREAFKFVSKFDLYEIHCKQSLALHSN